MNDIKALLDAVPNNKNIFTTLLKAHSILSSHTKCAVSVSGGSDSDIVMDLLELVKSDSCELAYVFFDTGLEYTATKQHLDALEHKYGATIHRRKPRKTIPIACREHGIPFISKDVSDVFGRLQRHGFDWSDIAENATAEKYGRCKSALDWYFSRRPMSRNGTSIFDIKRYKLLREFVIANPPAFKISERCCYYTKKQTSTDFHREYKPDLVITGMRRAEGGRRAGSISSCFTPQSNQSPDSYRPLWFWTDEDKAIYKLWRDIRYSDCYEIYGMKRTGCVGCPCNSRAEQELEITKRFEPHTAKAARNIFGASYIYRRQYAEFKSSFAR